MKCTIAGGGTGGHLFPGMAIAEAFIEREMGNEVLFIGTERGIEAKVLARGKFPLRTIHARPVKGRSLLEKVRAVGTTPKAVSEAMSILKEFQPQIVLGVGGYASGPTLLAAFLLGMKRAIHEQNVVPGMTNRILRWFSQKIFISFEETKKYFPGKKTVVTGNPVRKEIAASLMAGNQQAEKKKEDRFTVLIFGGSAGAHRLNEAMMEALSLLREIQSSLRFIHQTGSADVDFVSKGYHDKGFEALVKPFFEEMATYYRLADLVICRAGATTIAEVAVCGKAVIFVPYPFAARQHQLMNAQRLVDLEAARMIRDEELNGSSLAQNILYLFDHPEQRRKMGGAIRQVGRPRAAEEIVDHCYALIGKEKQGSLSL